MKKFILTFSMLALMAGYSSAFAQASTKTEKRQELTAPEKAKKRTESMTKTLNLDEKQQAELYRINLEHAQEQAKLKAERQALKAKFIAEKKAYSEHVNNTLTEEQKIKLEVQKAKKMEKKLKRKHPQPPVPPAPAE